MIVTHRQLIKWKSQTSSVFPHGNASPQVSPLLYAIVMADSPSKNYNNTASISDLQRTPNWVSVSHPTRTIMIIKVPRTEIHSPELIFKLQHSNPTSSNKTQSTIPVYPSTKINPRIPLQIDYILVFTIFPHPPGWLCPRATFCLLIQFFRIIYRLLIRTLLLKWKIE